MDAKEEELYNRLVNAEYEYITYVQSIWIPKFQKEGYVLDSNHWIGRLKGEQIEGLNRLNKALTLHHLESKGELLTLYIWSLCRAGKKNEAQQVIDKIEQTGVVDGILESMNLNEKAAYCKTVKSTVWYIFYAQDSDMHSATREAWVKPEVLKERERNRKEEASRVKLCSESTEPTLLMV